MCSKQTKKYLKTKKKKITKSVFKVNKSRWKLITLFFEDWTIRDNDANAPEWNEHKSPHMQMIFEK